MAFPKLQWRFRTILMRKMQSRVVETGKAQFGVKKYNKKITCLLKVLINGSHQLFARAWKGKKIPGRKLNIAGV